MKKKDMGIAQINIVPNTLTDWELNNGWELLFDGKTPKGWRGICMDQFPENNWIIEDGSLTVEENQNKSREQANIITEKKFSDFDLKFEFSLTENSSSGIEYFALNNPLSDSCFYKGLEYQIIDDKKEGLQKDQQLASLYGLNHGQRKFPSPIGQWNNGRIVARDSMVEHWLNNLIVMKFNRKDKEFRERVSNSEFEKKKFNSLSPFGESPEGYILLQDENSSVSYRSIKIREFKK
jgi:hypothetical protein